MTEMETLIATMEEQGEGVDVPAERIAAIVQLLKANTAEIHISSLIPRESSLMVWTIRGEHNKERNGPVEGYTGLLREMSQAKEDFLSIVSIKNTEVQYSIFVTPSYDRLMGVLYYPIPEIMEFVARRANV